MLHAHCAHVDAPGFIALREPFFHNLFRARFDARPNRFLVRATCKDGQAIEAFMPNPGRMGELLIPGVTLFIVHTPGKKRRTHYTCVAVERHGTPVFLHTHANNRVARHLIETGQVPGLRRARVVRQEVTMGRSRFDFLVEDHRGPCVVEVKSCTLFAHGTAMFPDAVTERGRRHLEELAELPRAAVIFVVHSAEVERFLPDYHTDLAFSQTLLAVRDRVRILPLAVGWDARLALTGPARLLPIPWRVIAREAQDRGAYLLVLHLPEVTEIAVGGLGTVQFEAGWYCYAGSAMTNLDARMARHKRLRKRLHWHIDYLRAHATEADAFPIRASQRHEDDLARACAGVYAPVAPGFGATDAPASTHLFYTGADPRHTEAFQDLLLRFRMGAR